MSDSASLMKTFHISTFRSSLTLPAGQPNSPEDAFGFELQCSEFNCLPGASPASQSVPISMDVTFVDASTTAVPEEKAKPVFLARLPYDFFYPFYVESGASAVGLSATTLSVSCAALALCIRAASAKL